MTDTIMVRRAATEIREGAARQRMGRALCGLSAHGPLCDPDTADRFADLLDAIADAEETAQRGPFWPLMSADPLLEVHPLGWDLAVQAAAAYLVPVGPEPV